MENERGQVEPLLDCVEKYIGAALAKGIIPILEGDKGYDSEQLRDKLLRRKFFPWICRRKKPGKEAEKVESILKRIRWKVERAISWLQRKFRRLAVRWERKAHYCCEQDGNIICDTGKSSGSLSPSDPLFAFITTVPALNANTFTGSASGNKTTTGNAGNSLVNWQNKDVNENHNTRISISNAQTFPCGVGLETKFSSSVNANQVYVAIRLGKLYKSNGTVRVSVNQQ